MNTQSSTHIPNCIGFIMDGNRRWAKAHGLPTYEGHTEGSEAFLRSVRWGRERGIAHMVFYAFSNENWNRAQDEVAYLMELFEALIQKLKENFSDGEEGETKIRFRFIGDIERFSEKLQASIRELEATTSYADMTVWVALSYGGRQEILDAVNKAVAQGEVVDEVSFRSRMWSAEMPDPDLVVRTGGEQRLSNFLPWQSVYSELLFLDRYWPDMADTDFDESIEMYASRKRNFGV